VEDAHLVYEGETLECFTLPGAGPRKKEESWKRYLMLSCEMFRVIVEIHIFYDL
jgi:hypothetical protein